MKFKVFIGIDVSKSTIDVFLRNGGLHEVFSNDEEGFAQLVEWIMDHTGEVLAREILVVFEPTGIYSRNLAVFLSAHGFSFSIVPGLELKRSMGIRRGKSDKADAQFIAEYAYEKRERLAMYEMPSAVLEELKKLVTLRERLVKQRAGFKASLGEYKRVFGPQEGKVYAKTQEDMIEYLTLQISKVEKEMSKLVKEDEMLKNQYKLITSIKGVGPQTALVMIVLTGGFTMFSSWRKFASYSGTAPFPNASGTYRGKTKTSNLANKRIKTLLTLCAGTSIQHNTEMRLYYEKRISEGKNEMGTLNIVRNKLIARIFAVVNRQSPYVDTLKFAA
jgi:transposase